MGHGPNALPLYTPLQANNNNNNTIFTPNTAGHGKRSNSGGVAGRQGAHTGDHEKVGPDHRGRGYCAQAGRLLVRAVPLVRGARWTVGRRAAPGAGHGRRAQAPRRHTARRHRQGPR